MTQPIDGPYTVRCNIEVNGYGTDQQAVQTAQRIRRMLNVGLHRSVRLTDIEVERRSDG